MKLLRYFLILVAFISTSSCEKFLEEEPIGFISPVNYYQTETHLNLALNGVYSLLYDIPTYGSAYPARMNMTADEAFYARGEIGMRTYTHGTADAENDAFWSSMYKGIDRANSLLANIHKPAMDETKRNVIRGEALFLRGYYYFLLVQNYGGVPLLTTPTLTPESSQVPRASVVEVYNQVLADMEAAEPLVLPITTIGFGGRVSQSAVRGILARVNLYMAGYPLKDVSRYAEARKWAKKVMDDTQAAHELNPDFKNIFIRYAQDSYDIKESIWEAEFYGSNANGNASFGNIGSLIGMLTPGVANLYGQAYGMHRATRRHYQTYEAGDIRRDWNISVFTYNGLGVKVPLNQTVAENNLSTPIPNLNLYTRYAAKFRREYELVNPKVAFVTPQNFPILRFADVLLMFAEAETQVNGAPTTAAIDAVNRVRRRGWSTGVKSFTVTNGGTTNYTSVPTVTITGGGGSGATAVATLTAGKVTRISFNFDLVHGYGQTKGSGYTSAPTVTISGGGGAGATATAAIHNVSEANLTAAQIASKDAFMDMLRDERMRELCYEALRKPDLIRWELFLPRMKLILADMQADGPFAAADAFFPWTYENVNERHLLFPIPSHEITLNQSLVQNPGW